MVGSDCNMIRPSLQMEAGLSKGGVRRSYNPWDSPCSAFVLH